MCSGFRAHAVFSEPLHVLKPYEQGPRARNHRTLIIVLRNR